MEHVFEAFTQHWQLHPVLMTVVIGLWMITVSAAVLAFMATFAGVTSWVERRIAGRMMSRIGPNRVGPQGFFQWLADGLKCFLKEATAKLAERLTSGLRKIPPAAGPRNSGG